LGPAFRGGEIEEKREMQPDEPHRQDQHQDRGNLHAPPGRARNPALGYEHADATSPPHAGVDELLVRVGDCTAHMRLDWPVIHVASWPRMPKRMSKKTWKQYFAGRDSFSRHLWAGRRTAILDTT
jgi:hypothetical protein